MSCYCKRRRTAELKACWECGEGRRCGNWATHNTPCGLGRRVVIGGSSYDKGGVQVRESVYLDSKTAGFIQRPLYHQYSYRRAIDTNTDVGGDRLDIPQFDLVTSTHNTAILKKERRKKRSHQKHLANKRTNYGMHICTTAHPKMSQATFERK